MQGIINLFGGPKSPKWGDHVKPQTGGDGPPPPNDDLINQAQAQIKQDIAVNAGVGIRSEQLRRQRLAQSAFEGSMGNILTGSQGLGGSSGGGNSQPKTLLGM